MKNLKVFKFTAIFLCIILVLAFIVTGVMFAKQSITDIVIDDNIIALMHNVNYKKKADVQGVPLIRQKVNCGYAAIETVAKYLGLDSVTEQSIYEENNKTVSTSTIGGFYSEIQKQIPDYKITQYSNLKNTEMIDKIYESLQNDMPVIFCFASSDKNLDKNDRKLTFNYGIVIGMDVANDEIIINDSYGYIDKYSVKDFLKTTRFDNYKNMDLYLKLGFSFGLFAKNTVYIIEAPENVSTVAGT